MADENQVDENAEATSKDGKPFNWGCLARVFVYLVCPAVLIYLLLPTVGSRSHESAARSRCRNNLKQIGWALHNYHAAYKCFPPPYTVDENGERMHSWRALILPFLTDNSGIGCGYDFNQPWNSPDNLAFAKTASIRKMFFCPTELRDNPDLQDTSYVILVGPDTALGNGTNTRNIGEIRDGTSNTIVAGEMSRSGIFWTEPRDLETDVMSFKLNDPYQIGLRSEHSGGLHAALADGSVTFLNNEMKPETIKAMITIDGGEGVEQW